jgi:hypothetical protein
MNCIGPTARSQRMSLSYCPASVSEIAWVLLPPLSGMPKIPGRETPSVPRLLPPYLP